MAEIPHPWRAYARLQQQAGRSRRADVRSWAVEAGLDHLLGAPVGAAEADEDVARAISAVCRREVHRGRILRRHAGGNNHRHPEAALHARLMLEAIRSRLTEPEWDILCDIGAGRSYDEIAEARGGTPGACRVRVLRLRRTLSERDAA
ncbi:MAG: hypothetical protein DI601_11220 [Azospirillum brasilense]|nr:MAG: hypothetical protein DI601_11220 [Azospirillum brasilense]